MLDQNWKLPWPTKYNEIFVKIYFSEIVYRKYVTVEIKKIFVLGLGREDHLRDLLSTD